ncbi:hypothetical protein OGAPHI_004588 [Ogataea philodendri]|uniref:DNA helicase n=2 Tax=Ogataea TaxID=461281 RepID=A0A9P8T3W7_9ASCO|nr:uncharacterized protein OGAPHI_004588 [Ogataea philodendri]KAH3664236.1 hypothetical protein OGAPHI_004588 [Ogataea philodendri]
MSSEYEDFEPRQGIVFALQLTPTMRPHLASILASVRELVREMVKTHSGTGVGCYLFHCQDGIVPVFELEDIGIDQLRALESFDAETVASRTQDPALVTADELVEVFQNSRDGLVKSYNVRRIFLFTDCDRPFNGATSKKVLLWNVLNDLSLDKINVVPFLLARDGKFDLSEYQTVFETLDQFRPSVEKLEVDQIQDKVFKTKELKRTSFRCTLQIKQIKMSVRGINLFREPKLQSPFRFYDDNGVYRYVETESVKLDSTSGARVADEDAVNTVGFGNQHMVLERRDIVGPLEPGDNPVLDILGFRDIAHFNPHYTIGTPQLVIPSEIEKYTHSRRTLATLYQSLNRTRKMAVVWGSYRKNMFPRLHYLVSTDKSFGWETSVDEYPEGLVLIPIPFRDDIRSLPAYVEKMDPSLLVIPNQFDELVGELVDLFQPLDNPQIEWYFKVFEDHLLQREVKYDQAVSLEIQKQQTMNGYDELKRKCMELRQKIADSETLRLLFQAARSEINKMDNYQELNVEDGPLRKKALLLTDDVVIKAYKLDKLEEFSLHQLKVYMNSKAGLIGNHFFYLFLMEWTRAQQLYLLNLVCYHKPIGEDRAANYGKIIELLGEKFPQFKVTRAEVTRQLNKWYNLKGLEKLDEESEEEPVEAEEKQEETNGEEKKEETEEVEEDSLASRTRRKSKDETKKSKSEEPESGKEGSETPAARRRTRRTKVESTEPEEGVRTRRRSVVEAAEASDDDKDKTPKRRGPRKAKDEPEENESEEKEKEKTLRSGRKLRIKAKDESQEPEESGAAASESDEDNEKKTPGRRKSIKEEKGARTRSTRRNLKKEIEQEAADTPEEAKSEPEEKKEDDKTEEAEESSESEEEGAAEESDDDRDEKTPAKRSASSTPGPRKLRKTPLSKSVPRTLKQKETPKVTPGARGKPRGGASSVPSTPSVRRSARKK